MRVLVVEDDADLARQLHDCLSDAGYAVDLAPDGEEGHYLGANEPYDAVVLDLGLPIMDGISVLESWRRAGRTMPVLILTARDRWNEKVAGFDAGADDYVAKPFHMRWSGAPPATRAPSWRAGRCAWTHARPGSTSTAGRSG
jgi:two-component system OmpR family response regulator